MTGRDDKMPSVLVLELRGRPSLGRTAVIRKDDEPHDVRHLLVGDGRCFIGPPGTTGDDGGWWGTVGDNTMSSVLVLGSYLSGKFWKRRDGTTKCRPSSSCPVANTAAKYSMEVGNRLLDDVHHNIIWGLFSFFFKSPILGS